jgi:UDP-2-acetamido-2,6-beta-L-arabino-hexul-4-ose reductase
MNVVVTGAEGFIGKNLVCHLTGIKNINIFPYTRGDSLEELEKAISGADRIVHLAGVNRPENDNEFNEVNAGLTRLVCDIAAATGRRIPIIFSSSTQAGNDSAYGNSKLHAEKILEEYAGKTGSEIWIYRLPGIFGKWCKPDYNSVVATFCHKIARRLPVRNYDDEKIISLNYIDDLVESILMCLEGKFSQAGNDYFITVDPVYNVSLGTLVETLKGFRDGRQTLRIDKVGSGFKRALYATYLSYLDANDFSYHIQSHSDHRGSFVEFLKTTDSGQVSYFTAKPGVSRGQHYHHTKTEKFLVVQGEAIFRFRQIHSDKFHEINVTADEPVVVESIPGWAHDVTNTGPTDLIVLLWSSEVFDQNRPDTIPKEI